MAKLLTVTPSRETIMKNSKKVTAHRAAQVTKAQNINTPSNMVDDCVGVDKASAKVRSQANPSTSHEKSVRAEFAEENNAVSEVYLNMSFQALSCDMCTEESDICLHCTGDGQNNYDAWSDNTGGHGFTTDMNKPGDKIQLQIWSYETSHITVAERLEQRKWCDPGHKL